MSIHINHITKSFGSFRALNDISLEIPSNLLVALLGPSGSGKTTLLRIIAGLDAPDEGSLVFKNENNNEITHAQKVGFVFQHYALFRHMTVFDNIAFGLKVMPRGTRPGKAEISEKVHQLLDLIQLSGIANRYPHQLSGGQRQRVALARALAINPKVLLLDEPFGALDAKVRFELRRWLRNLHKTIQVTSIFVTHDQEEALEVADLVVVMNNGNIEQIGSPYEVFHHPANEFVMNFIGHVNQFQGRIEDGKASFGNFDLADPVIGAQEKAAAKLLVRPHEISIHPKPQDEKDLVCVIDHVHKAGPRVQIELRDDSGRTLSVEMSHSSFEATNLQNGDTAYVSFLNSRLFIEKGHHP